MHDVVLSFPKGRMDSLKCGTFKADVLADDNHVGWVSFTPLTGRIAKIGYEINPEWRGKGLATKAARQIMGWAFREGFITLLTGARCDNRASWAVLWKTGWRVDYITTEDDGDYYQCRVERDWQHAAKDAYWLPNIG